MVFGILAIFAATGYPQKGLDTGLPVNYNSSMTKKQQRKRGPRVSVRHTAVHRVFPFIFQYMQANHGLAPTLSEIGKEFRKSREWARY